MEEDFERTLEILREAHREAIPEAHFAAVRSRVLAQLETKQKSWWPRRIWAYGLLAGALAVVMMFWPKPTPQPRVTQQTVAAVSRPQDETPPLPAPVAHIRRHRLPARPAVYRVVGPPVAQPLVVKLLTNDPTVVIYWFSGE